MSADKVYQRSFYLYFYKVINNGCKTTNDKGQSFVLTRNIKLGLHIFTCTMERTTFL